MGDKPAEIKARHRASRQGPYRWYGNTDTKQIYLATAHGGRIIVMDFARYGTQSAQPRFLRDLSMVGADKLVEYEASHREDISGINHPDAIALEKSWEDREYLINALEQSEACRVVRMEALEATLEWMGKISTGNPAFFAHIFLADGAPSVGDIRAFINAALSSDGSETLERLRKLEAVVEAAKVVVATTGTLSMEASGQGTFSVGSVAEFKRLDEALAALEPRP